MRHSLESLEEIAESRPNDVSILKSPNYVVTQPPYSQSEGPFCSKPELLFCKIDSLLNQLVGVPMGTFLIDMLKMNVICKSSKYLLSLAFISFAGSLTSFKQTKLSHHLNFTIRLLISTTKDTTTYN